jgi:superfamily II DNA/RNA helicase
VSSVPPPDLPWQLVDVDAAPVSFASLGFDRRLAAGLADLGFEGTRPVQGAVIPLALADHDVVACAETGTGKTLAFAVPILQRLLTEQPHYHDPAREPYTRRCRSRTPWSASPITHR